MTANLDMLPGSFKPTLPLHMVWLSTNRCNARCAHCSSNSSEPYPDELSTQEAYDLIDQLSEAGVLDLAISGGEPLMRDDLFDILQYARSKDISVGVGSNGAHLSDDQARRLKQSGISRFQVSLDGNSDQHDALRRWPGLYLRVLNSIKKARDAGLTVNICCTINKLNYNSLASFVEFAASLGIRRLNLSRFIPTGRGDPRLDIPDHEWKDVIHECAELKLAWQNELIISTHLSQQILVDSEIRDMPAFIGCQAGIGQGAVSANGHVFPCVLLPLSLGNVREMRLKDIWLTSPTIKALHDRTSLSGHCTICPQRDRCGGCRALAYARTGSCLDSDPRCWL
jgi:radical SAM protein with 4Fe4S-binding SPASM domain